MLMTAWKKPNNNNPKCECWNIMSKDSEIKWYKSYHCSKCSNRLNTKPILNNLPKDTIPVSEVEKLIKKYTKRWNHPFAIYPIESICDDITEDLTDLLPKHTDE